MVELYSLVGGINLIVSNHMLVVTQLCTPAALRNSLHVLCSFGKLTLYTNNSQVQKVQYCL